MKKIFSIIMVVALLLSMLTAGNEASAAAFTDIVGRVAISSFKEMTDALEFPPALDETLKMWVLTSPDGEASFWWRSEANDNRHMQDVQICFNAEPFVSAGLDLDKLPAEMKVILDTGKLIMGKQLSREALVYNGGITPLSSFEQIVKLDRESISYHAPMDHFGVAVADGCAFEWAKDMSVNDKDIVFVLDPKIFIDAGVDPDKVEGWTFTKIPMMSERGRKFETDKFVKGFDLK